jgi:aryl-alcohol dehydrogenase-like predicted oxidoreductase
MATHCAGILGLLDIPLGLGLPTEDRDEAISVVHFALDQGIRVLDVDCLGDDDPHFGERLVRHTLDRWHGPNEQVKILTKVPSDHPDQIRRSVDESLQALGVDRLFLLLLQARDPHVPIDETLAALAELQQQGKIEHLGLCNVTPAELHQAQRHFRVAAVQNELSVLHRDSANNGLVMLTQEQGIMFLASNPLGGQARVVRLAKNHILIPLSQRHQVTPQEIALGALLDASPHIVPLISATSIESVRTCVAATRLSLDVSDRTALALGMSFTPDPEALAAVRQLFVKDKNPKVEVEPPPKKSRRPVPVDSSFVIPATAWAKVRPCFGLAPTPDVVILMGIPGAGKSFLADDYEGRGYVRISRGRKDDQVPRLHQALDERHKLVVLDDNYPTRLSRARSSR